MGSHSYRVLMCCSRKFHSSEVQPPEDVRQAFSKYAGTSTTTGKGAHIHNHMTSAQLRHFLVDHQAFDSTVADSESERIFHLVSHRRRHLFFNKSGLTIDDFFHYLFSEDLNGPINTEVHHDMKAPLQHYFIYTGHNSYLTGNQLSSDSSDIPIIKALQRGVRVIELDLWPNPSKDDIDVLHGRTLTAPISLIKCLTSIREHAFEKSPYPVIITLEDHLTPDLQAKVAKMVDEIFGGMLYYPESSDDSEEFPSPEELKHRIILSTKPPKEYLESKPSIDDKEGSGSRASLLLVPKEDDPSVGGSTRPAKEEENSKEEVEDDQLLEEINDSGPEDLAAIIPEEELAGNQLTAPEYHRLIAIRAGKPKNGLREALCAEFEKVRRLSLNEVALEKAAAEHGTHLVRFTQKNFLRIYPKGLRVNSSNYDPMVAWTHGAQMVAFNMQGYGRSLWLMQGMFRANGGCGYLKKPDILMNHSTLPDPQYSNKNKVVFDPRSCMDVKTILKVRVYMGDGWRLDFSKTHFDGYSPPDFYTELRIVGVPADSQKEKTRVIEDDWVPVWDQEFSFKLRVPELALLQIVVGEYDMSEKDDFGGQTCLPVSQIKPGIRAVPLFNKKGEKLPSVKLLMRFQFVPCKIN